MATLKEESQAYEPKRTLNIADLDRVDISAPMEDRTGTDKDNQTFSYKVMIINGIDYRVPFSVLEEIQKMLKLKPELTHVKVIQSGSGLNTRYAVELIE